MRQHAPRFLFVAALIAPAYAYAAPAVSESPESALKKALAEVLAAVKGRNNTDPVELAKRVRPILEKFFNFESLTRRAIGPGWKELSPEQQRKSVDLFSEIIIRSYTSRFDPSSQIDLQFVKPVDLGNDRKEVPAVAKYAGNSVAVAYRVEPSPQGWKVYDVVIEGVSLASNYRSQFDAIRQKGGPDALVRSMQEKLK